MAKIGYVDAAMKVAYDTQGTQTGLTDLLATVYDTANTEIVGSPFTMVEIGTTGVYNATFTPDTVGEYTVIVNSALSSPVIANKAGTLQILEDLYGATYDAATDSLEAIRGLGDSMDGKLDTISGYTDTIEGVLTTMDGKIDTIDGIVDSIQIDTDSIEGKVDIIDTTTTDTNTKVSAIPGATGSVI